MQSHKNNNNKYYTSTAPCTTDPFITMWTPFGSEHVLEWRWECLCFFGGMAGGVFSELLLLWWLCTLSLWFVASLEIFTDELWQLVCGPFGDEDTLVWWLQSEKKEKTILIFKDTYLHLKTSCYL
jgi:hypothetical protein